MKIKIKTNTNQVKNIKQNTNTQKNNDEELCRIYAFDKWKLNKKFKKKMDKVVLPVFMISNKKFIKIKII